MTTLSRAGTKLSFSRPELVKCFPILLEVGSREVVDFVRYASAKLSSAARGKSFHLATSFSAMSSGSSNLIRKATFL
jgi:hypothetical protein